MDLFRYDRRLGESIRTRVARVPGGSILANIASRALSPGFHLAVGAALLTRRHRVTGVLMLLSGVISAVTARVLPDHIARPRPGEREDAGFPSRHAAASSAIALTAVSRRPILGLALAAFAAIGVVGRVATGQHDPADVAAGGLLGAVVAHLVAHPLSPLRLLIRSVGLR